MNSAPLSPCPYLTFALGGELFAVEVAHVQEIIELPEITRVPAAPFYLRGVVNVRGKAIPIVDLRLKFGLPPTANTLETRVVVMELTLDGETLLVGGIADSVREVIELEAAQIAPPPRLATRWRSELIKGMSRRVINLLSSSILTRSSRPTSSRWSRPKTSIPSNRRARL